MGWMSQIGNLLEQYTSGSSGQQQVEKHYDQVAEAAPSSALAGGLADAMRSDQTPPFAQLAAQLFGNSDGGQKANLLAELLSTAGPGVSQALAGSAGGGLLSQLLSSGRNITAEDAQAIPPETVQELAQHAQSQNSSIIDRVSSIYAEHPTLVKTLGAGVLSIAMAKMAERMKA